LPESQAATSIADHALLQVLQHPNRSNGRTLRQHLRHIRQQLQYHVRKEINRLHHRKENRCLCNEPDLKRTWCGDGKPDSPIDLIRDAGPSPTDTIIWDEESRRLDTLKAKFLAFLGRHKQLKNLFRCLCAGISEPKALAAKLHLKLSTIRSLKRRLALRINTFKRAQNTRETPI
jgi:hypothetical protein